MAIQKEIIYASLSEYFDAQKVADGDPSILSIESKEQKEIRLGLRACTLLLQNLLEGGIPVDDSPKPTANEGVLLSISKASRESGISIGTIRKWAESGFIECYWTPGGQRRIPSGAVTKAVKAGLKPN
jgi:hypothetical protein